MAPHALKSFVRLLHRTVSPEGEFALADAELLERFVTVRDEAAFELLVWRHGGLVLGLCRRLLRHEQDVEDVFQATFLVLMRKAAMIGKRELLSGWLYTVARRLALRVRADAARRSRYEQEQAAALQGRNGEEEPEVDSLWSELRPVIDEELDRLPRKYRESVLLCYLEGKTVAEAAEQLGCPRSTVGNRLARAKDRLRAGLARRGLEPIPAVLLGAVLTQNACAATVPSSLVFSTARAAAALMAGGSAPVVTTAVAALLEGGLSSMSVTKWKMVLALSLGLLLSAGAGAAFVGKPKEKEKPTAKVAARPGAPRPAEVARLRQRHACLHEQPVSAVVLGKGFLIAGDASGALKRWDTKTGKLEESFFEVPADPKLAIPVDTLQLTRGGAKLNIVARGGMMMSEADIKKEGRKSPGGGSGGGSRIFGVTPDGKAWALIRDDKKELLFLQNTFGDNVLPSIGAGSIPHDSEVAAVAFDPDSSRVFTLTADGAGHLADVKKGKVAWSATAKDLVPTVAAFSPDGKSVAVAGKKGAVRLLATADGKAGKVFRAHADPVTALAWLPCGKRLATASEDKSVRIWDAATGKLVAEAKKHAGAVRCLAVSGDGRLLASGGDDKAVRIWELPE